MNNTHRTHYIIYIRPLGSHIWTQHMKKFRNGTIPYVEGRFREAEEEAHRISEQGKYCTAIVQVILPREPDERLSVRLPDQDTVFIYAD